MTTPDVRLHAHPPMSHGQHVPGEGTPRRCVIFFYEGYVGVQPTVANLAKAMGRAGHQVTIYAAPTWAPEAGDLGDGVRIEYLRAGPLLERIGQIGVGRYRLKKIAGRLLGDPTLFALRGLILEARREAASRRAAGRRSVYVGVDPNGGVAAWLSAAILRRSHVFLSLELKKMERLRTGLRGRFVRLAYRRAACVVVQGTDRLEVLARELRWKHQHVFLLPNGPFAEDSAATPQRAFNLRTKLMIGATRRVALQAGMINEVTCAEELAKGFAGSPDWALVLHERQKREPTDPYLARLREINPRNLYLSLDPVPYDEIDGVFAAADIGLAFYQSRDAGDENFRLVSSSGKLPHYLKHGKPLLVSNLPSLVEVVETFECGFVINDPSDAGEIASALEKVQSRYETLSRNAARCFAERYDFGKKVAALAQFMDGL